MGQSLPHLSSRSAFKTTFSFKFFRKRNRAPESEQFPEGHADRKGQTSREGLQRPDSPSPLPPLRGQHWLTAGLRLRAGAQGRGSGQGRQVGVGARQSQVQEDGQDLPQAASRREVWVSRSRGSNGRGAVSTTDSSTQPPAGGVEGGELLSPGPGRLQPLLMALPSGPGWLSR